MNKKIRWITETALLLALLIVLQSVTKSFGQFVTGSCVNAVLALAALLTGLGSGITIAVISPVLAFLLGFASIGVVLLPVSAAAFGFFLSFAVCCFTAAFGPDGVLLALAALGLRCVVTMPCFFLLASSSCGTAAGLAAVSFGSGRRTAPACGRVDWRRFGACSLALAAGVCGELTLTPALLRLALRDALFEKLGRGGLSLSGGSELLRRAAARYPAEALVRALDRVTETEIDLKNNANAAMSLQALFVGILEGR